MALTRNQRKGYLAAAVAVMAAALLAGCGQVASPAADTSHVSPHTTITKVVTAPPTKIIIKLTPAPAPPAPAPAPAQPVMRDIGGGIYANSSTSTAFALNVVSAWDGNPGVKYVYSPVTGVTYAVNYQIIGAGTVVATTATGAYVQF
jgi:hypothetical protein